MNDMTNFYDTLDLKYPEIGIAMQDIDRSNPGMVKVIIPILTPKMDNSKLINKNIYQHNTNNLKNKNPKHSINIHDVSLTNYIEIPFPKEICMTYDDEQIIKSGSKWLIIFVGGDITKPRPIARYLD